MDETGLFWRKPPFGVSPAQDLLTTKRENSRVCFMLCTNSTGSDRLPLWVIGHTHTPEALRRVNLKAMDIHWRYHRQAWLTQSIMQEWLLFFYNHVGDRRVLLLLDSHPDHQAAVEATPPPPNVQMCMFNCFLLILALRLNNSRSTRESHRLSNTTIAGNGLRTLWRVRDRPKIQFTR
jgi:hypothetical protein